jgi:dTDP-glucose pyrophosphorylase
MKPQLEGILIKASATILEAVKAIDRGGMQIALVVDGERRLLATVTDGDVRRGLLRGVSLEAPVTEIMHGNPAAVRSEDGRDGALRVMQRLSVHQVPTLDSEGRVVGIERIDDFVGLQSRDTWIVLMAGGRGIRLRPLTETIPKPMLPVGGRPLLESIIRNIKDQGYQRFFISVNHRREVVQDHFGDGSSLGVSIEYLIERESLGTAGALSLLPERPSHTIVVMNADLLTSVRFDQLLQYHADQGVEATMCAREFISQVPYGVVRFDGPRLMEIEEKPTQRHFVNAGIYALSPSVFDLIAKDRPLDMPDLFSALIERKRPAAVFPIREYWMDIGQMDDLQRARDEFEAVFGP